MSRLIPIKYSINNTRLYYIFVFNNKIVCKGYYNFCTEYFYIEKTLSKKLWEEEFLNRLQKLDYSLSKKVLKRLENKIRKKQNNIQREAYRLYLKIFCR